MCLENDRKCLEKKKIINNIKNLIETPENLFNSNYFIQIVDKFNLKKN